MIDGVLFDKEVLAKLIKSTRRHAPIEAGGLLLGYRKNRYLHVIEATTPFQWDRQSRIAFIRSSKAHRIRALRLWRKSGKLVDWLGEWHSHPGFLATPSGIDYRNWKRITGHRKAPMVFPICDGNDVNIWIQQSKKIKPIRLMQADQDEEGQLFKPIILKR